MSTRLHLLERALRDGQGTTARQVIRRELDPADQDDLLALLVRSAGADNPVATELFIEYLDDQQIVHRFVRGALLDEAAIDDVAQDALISIAASVHTYSGRAKVTTWIHRIVRNRIVDHLRRQRATAPLPAEELGAGERMSSMIATRATVRTALAALPERYRHPVTLRDLDGWSYAHIAEQLQRSVGTVKSQVARGRALVATMLREAPVPQDGHLDG